MAGLIDLNTTEDDETPSSGSSASSSSVSILSASGSASTPAGASGFASSSVCLELWHACAGPLISLPRKGSVVVYLPQGHLEQVSDFPAAAYELPPHLFCRVVDVKLHAEEGTDEVYAQVSLVPETEQIEQKLRDRDVDEDGEEEDIEAAAKSTTPHMFCKTLTASDTSTHGGFSVPRRAAEDCFPSLDYKQQRPSQELVAKDLHGLEWRFRHIYRGQPRRHLLTTGWSAFVNKKKLVSGDAVLFLRGDDGELRLGIRRAAQVKDCSTFPTLYSQQLNYSSLTDVVNAISSRSSFSIYYNPRASSSDFIVPLRKFLKSLDRSFSVGMRFKMRFETEDAAERRYTGLVTGIGDMDPVRWPGSKWRCLVVRWDDVDTNRHGRVSPWEIEPSGSAPSSASFMAPGLKRTRIGLSSAKPEFPVPNGIGASDFGESLRFQKVLQGQEIMGFDTPFDGIGTQNLHPSETRRGYPGSNSSGIAAIGNIVRNPHMISDNITPKGIGFGESFRFHKVLQGQEIHSSSPCGRVPTTNEANQYGGLGIYDGVQVPNSRNGWSTLMQSNNAHVRPSAQSVQVSSPSSVLMFQHAMNPVSNFNSMYNGHNQEDQRNIKRSLYMPESNSGKHTSSFCNRIFSGEDHGGRKSLHSLTDHIQQGISNPHVAQTTHRSTQDVVVSCKSSCRLFGFSLTEEKRVPDKECNSTPATSPLNAGASLFPNVGGQFHSKPPLMAKAVGSNCTKELAFDWCGDRMEYCLQG
ncbi:auxin response factor 3 [Ziziphus jujuba]|uniref:Auxin response factor n=3 Tax=Ziziphus jujuba TaxID=326968 RepID=A0A6P3ZNL9_ZIZJJ|nr:auxin response factor 3 [Ziziphus jujuba]XP_015875211.3 auxin response factor 3 [Ziziphus jujuba]